jgi:hypothetical protein
VKPHRFLLTVLAGTLVLALARAAAAAQRGGRPAHGGYYDPFFWAVLSLTKWLQLDAGVGYRLIGGADVLNHDLRGISSGIAVQFGGR